MTPEQKALARHALGLTDGRRVSYRNRFTTARGRNPDLVAWLAMVKAGEAEEQPARRGRRSAFRHFSLTRHGAELALEPGERLDSEDFP